MTAAVDGGLTASPILAQTVTIGTKMVGHSCYGGEERRARPHANTATPCHVDDDRSLRVNNQTSSF